MIRALYSAASGMTAQQMNVDNIAHNLSNVNTAGFKKSRVEFSDVIASSVSTDPRKMVGSGVIVKADGAVRLPMSLTEMQTELTGTVTVICGDESAPFAAVSIDCVTLQLVPLSVPTPRRITLILPSRLARASGPSRT